MSSEQNLNQKREIFPRRTETKSLKYGPDVCREYRLDPYFDEWERASKARIYRAYPELRDATRPLFLLVPNDAPKEAFFAATVLKNLSDVRDCHAFLKQQKPEGCDSAIDGLTWGLTEIVEAMSALRLFPYEDDIASRVKQLEDCAEGGRVRAASSNKGKYQARLNELLDLRPDRKYPDACRAVAKELGVKLNTVTKNTVDPREHKTTGAGE